MNIVCRITYCRLIFISRWD